MRLALEKIILIVLAIVSISVVAILSILYLSNKRIQQELQKKRTANIPKTNILPSLEKSPKRNGYSPHTIYTPNSSTVSAKPNWVEYSHSLSFQFPKWMKLKSFSNGDWFYHQLIDERSRRLVEIGITYADGLERAKQWFNNLIFKSYNHPLGTAFKGTPLSLNDSEYIVYLIEPPNSPNIWVIGILPHFDQQYIPDNPANPRQYAANLIEEIVQSIRLYSQIRE